MPLYDRLLQHSAQGLLGDAPILYAHERRDCALGPVVADGLLSAESRGVGGPERRVMYIVSNRIEVQPGSPAASALERHDRALLGAHARRFRFWRRALLTKMGPWCCGCNLRAGRSSRQAAGDRGPSGMGGGIDPGWQRGPGAGATFAVAMTGVVSHGLRSCLDVPSSGAPGSVRPRSWLTNPCSARAELDTPIREEAIS